MPVDMSRYPDNWSDISQYIRFERAEGKCEWCGVEHGAIGARDSEGNFIPVDVIDKCQTMQSDAGYSYLNSFGWDDYPKLIKIILTTAHLGVDKPDGTKGDKHDKMDCRYENLASLCQKCHLNYDRDEHIENRRESAYQKKLAEKADNGHQLLPMFDEIVEG